LKELLGPETPKKLSESVQRFCSIQARKISGAVENLAASGGARATRALPHYFPKMTVLEKWAAAAM
jgi:hypothetical protein